jgi:hypothetical protein
MTVSEKKQIITVILSGNIDYDLLNMNMLIFTAAV